MTTSVRLRERLNAALAPQGMHIRGPLDYPVGGQRHLDTCRWCGVVSIDPSTRPMLSIASWDTMTECLKSGFTLTFNQPRTEADIMVDAKSPAPPPSSNPTPDR